MARLRMNIAMSLDGFVAGPGQSLENPLGVGGMGLHEWAFALAAWRAPHGKGGGEVNASTAVMQDTLANVGATVMGRNMFGGGPGPWGAQPWDGWWGEDPPFHTPVFVLTHHAREPLHKDGGTTFHFVTGGVDVLLAFPPLVFALAVTTYLGQSVLNITLVIGILGIPAFTRVARAVTLSLSEREFVTAARALGATHSRILLRELLPNVALPLLAFFLLGVAVTIVVEGALSFLGLGVPPPAPSWGSMIGEGRESLDIAPWLAFLPAGFMFLTVLSFNIVGDTLRALTDPRPGAL